MRRAWGLQPEAVFKQLEKGIYLVELTNRGDYQKVLDEGPWSYRQELVVTAPCNSQRASQNPDILTGELWVQFHNIPFDSLNEEGISLLTAPIGKAVSDPVLGHIGGKQFFKVKMAIALTERLKDTVSLRHPTMGEVIVYAVYERVGRACVFCAKIGHEIGTCADRTRLARIRNKEENKGRADMQNILKPTIGLWVTDPMLIPNPSAEPKKDPIQPVKSTGQKRSLQETGEGPHFPQLTTHETPEGSYTVREDGEMSEEDQTGELLTKKQKAARRTSPPIPI